MEGPELLALLPQRRDGGSVTARAWQPVKARKVRVYDTGHVQRVVGYRAECRECGEHKTHRTVGHARLWLAAHIRETHS